MKGHLDDQVKQKRFEYLMKRQAGISRGNNRKYIGNPLSVLVDKAAEGKDGMMIGRTVFQAPEIDGIVYINGTAEPGSLVTVRITEAHEYDLAGDII
ncbi:MAG: TRAM domain-containing protein [Deltaproteobacteria bacterium]|nr:TRAM domain-containing protein [Deltaproteobacteria bacterium]